MTDGGIGFAAALHLNLPEARPALKRAAAPKSSRRNLDEFPPPYNLAMSPPGIAATSKMGGRGATRDRPGADGIASGRLGGLRRIIETASHSAMRV